MPYPSNCTQSYQISRGETELAETDCIRGDNASLFQYGFAYVWVWLSIGFCLYVMCQVYNHVYMTESRTRSYTPHLSEDEGLKMTKQVKTQSMVYVSYWQLVEKKYLCYELLFYVLNFAFYPSRL